MHNHRQNTRELLTRQEAAEYLGTTAATLASWACTKAVQIPYIKIGRNVRYRRRDLDAWLDAHTVGCADTAGR